MQPGARVDFHHRAQRAQFASRGAAVCCEAGPPCCTAASPCTWRCILRQASDRHPGALASGHAPAACCNSSPARPASTQAHRRLAVAAVNRRLTAASVNHQDLPLRSAPICTDAARRVRKSGAAEAPNSSTAIPCAAATNSDRRTFERHGARGVRRARVRGGCRLVRDTLHVTALITRAGSRERAHSYAQTRRVGVTTRTLAPPNRLRPPPSAPTVRAA